MCVYIYIYIYMCLSIFMPIMNKHDQHAGFELCKRLANTSERIITRTLATSKAIPHARKTQKGARARMKF